MRLKLLKRGALMILLRADPELDTIFRRLIKTIGVKVDWDGVFLIVNNNLILVGDVRSVFFDFGHKKLSTNVVEVPIVEKNIKQIADNKLLTNILNMTLYVFGKWGTIGGLKVEKDYSGLNELFQNILKEVEVEPSFRDDNFRFYKDGLQITYEDVIQEVLSAAKEDLEEEKTEQDLDNEYKLGLWHKVYWKTENHTFTKGELGKEEGAKSRLGHNFYMVPYQCPVCMAKLYMVLYPVDEEYLIETDEERVYLARAYTCSKCNTYYTPRPGKLLQEGDVYVLKFDEDKAAYDDYLELVGDPGTRTPNYKFNEYESQRNIKAETALPTLEEAISGTEELPLKKLEELKEKMETGFYPWEEAEKYNKKVEEKIIKKKRAGKKEDPQSGFSPKPMDGTKSLPAGSLPNEHSKGKSSVIKDKYDASMEVVARMSDKQLAELRTRISQEEILDKEQKETYFLKIDQTLLNKAKGCKGKTYTEINRLEDEIRNAIALDSIKEEALKILYEFKKKQGEKEVEQLIAQMPAQVDKRQYQLITEKLVQYAELVDTSPYRDKMRAKLAIGEKLEIEELVRRGGKKDRNALLRLYDQLKERGFEEENVKPFLERIHDKIYALDESSIDKICPDIMNVGFKEGLEAYDKISTGIFLPELKENVLEMLDKRLTKIKMEENQQLVRKLHKDMDEKVKNQSRLYFYDSRKMLRGEEEEKALAIINKVLNTYGANLAKYEIPILICDSSFSSNGKEGFLLTMDHIFYNGKISAGILEVMNMDEVTASTGLIRRGVYAKAKGRKKVRLPNGVNAREWKDFAEVLNNFVKYLQEKPVSRNVEYLAKEKHTVKCCYRCGYVYNKGNICPKCGYKANK